MVELTPLNLNLDTFEVIFDKLSSNTTAVNEELQKVGAVIHEETFIASDGQTVFNLENGEYTPQTHTLEVSIDNVPQYLHQGFNETSRTSFSVTEPLELGQVVRVRYYSVNTKMSVVYVEDSYSLNGGSFDDVFDPLISKSINGGDFDDIVE